MSIILCLLPQFQGLVNTPHFTTLSSAAPSALLPLSPSSKLFSLVFVLGGGSKFPYDLSETCHFFAEAFYLLTCFKCFYNSSQNHFYNDYFRIFIANSNVYSSQHWYLLIVLFLWCWQLRTLIVCYKDLDHI